MDWQVAIPSYARAEGLKKWSLSTLRRGGVPADRVVVFVADEEQRGEYVKVLERGTYAEIVVAEPGILGVRNHITRHYPDGALLISVDDDVRGVKAVVNGRLVDVDDLPGLFDAGFEACALARARLWGLYPVCNAFYMKGASVTTDLRSVVGVLHGIVNDHSLVLRCVGGKEDLERTLLYFEKDRAVVRFNHLAPDHRPHAPGGLEATDLRTQVTTEEAVRYLVQRWPQWVKVKRSFARGHAEVQLSSKVRKAKS